MNLTDPLRTPREGDYQRFLGVGRWRQRPGPAVAEALRYGMVETGLTFSRTIFGEMAMQQQGVHSIFKQQFLDQRIDALKPHVPLCVPETATTAEAIELLQQHNEGAVLITQADGGELAGIFSERDALNKLPQHPRDDSAAPIAAMMTANPIAAKHFTTVARALFLMVDHGFRHLPIIDADQRPTGLLSIKQVVHYLYREIAQRVIGGSAAEELVDANAVEKFFARSVMSLAPRPAVNVQQTDSVADVVGLLRDRGIGSVLVLSGETLSGIFTERDFLLKIALRKVEPQAPISALMTPNPKSVLHCNTIAMALGMMADGGFRHVPVVDEREEIIGVISVRDVLKAVVEGIIEQLQQK